MTRFAFTLLLTIFAIGSYSQEQATEEVSFKPKLRRKCTTTLKSMALDKRVPEGSGLTAWNGQLWTHNDSGKASLFAMDTLTGAIVKEYPLPNVKNTDWEEISQDGDYFYIGDFGNNSGKRSELKILRISKASLLQENPVIETILFRWPETITNKKVEKVNFDCEAMIVSNDSIYLFTKEWKRGRRTRVFSIPKTIGSHSAKYKCTLKTRLLVTGANYNAEHKKLVLCGYNLHLRPSLLVFDGMEINSDFPATARKIKIRKRFRQIEGIATFDGKRYYLINEDFRFWFLHTKQALHVVEIKE